MYAWCSAPSAPSGAPAAPAAPSISLPRSTNRRFRTCGRFAPSCERVIQPEALYRTPNALAPHYSRFGVSTRILLTGHSHQAWPDCGFEAQQQAWLDAARLVDDKWERAFEQADRVRQGFARLLADRNGHYALGTS